MYWHSLNKSSVQNIIFKYNLFNRIFWVIPNAVALTEQCRNINRIVTHKSLPGQNSQTGKPVESERFEFIIGIISDQIPALLGFFQKTRSGLSKSQISGTKKQVSPPKTLAYSLTVRIFRATKPPLSYRRPHSGSGYAAPPVYRAPKGSRWVPYRHGSCP